MEEILSSIKRIIAEDGDGAAAKAAVAKSERESRSRAVVADMVKEAEETHSTSYVDEVLELTEEMPKAARAEKSLENPAPAENVAAEEDEGEAMELHQAERTIVSAESEMAARSSLAALSSMLVKPEAGENTLEGLVREMLRPMLKDWLDANLPTLVEGMVAKEIARITGRAL